MPSDAPPSFRNRRFMWTLYPDASVDPQEYLDALPKEHLRYVIFGVESCPTTGRRHFQGYAQATLAMRLRSIKQIFGRTVNVQIQRAEDDIDPIDYCKKDGDFYEWGRPAAQGKSREADVLLEIVKSGGSMHDVLREATGHGWCQYSRGIAAAHRMLVPPRSPEDPPTVCIYWGAAGVGKTRSAWDQGAFPIRWRDPFILGYSGQRKVCINDFDPRSMSRCDFLNLTDRYPFEIEVKGSSIQWSPDLIIFTSNYSPLEWTFKCGSVWDDAAARRITEIKEFN